MVEHIHLDKNGNKRIIEIHAFPIFDKEGNLSQIIEYSFDITKRQKAEAELRKHREQLEDLVKERTNELEATQEELVKHEKLSVLGQLTATVSHELRNPLGVIQSSAFYLINNTKDSDEKNRKHLKRIDEQVGLCDKIIGDLMEYTRGRRSKMFKGDLNTWLEEVLDGMTFPEPVHMLREMAPDFPMVCFDREKLQRVVNNLVTNAIQAVVVRQEGWKDKDDPYQPQVKLATLMVENGVSIEVEDNGAGMDEETAARVFEPLFTTKARGSGLGLAIVKKIVEEHSGAVSIGSDPERGTKVTVVIPLQA
jgi:signal transduction histidine kinase